VVRDYELYEPEEEESLEEGEEGVEESDAVEAGVEAEGLPTDEVVSGDEQS
jgi:hypothetical protein